MVKLSTARDAARSQTEAVRSPRQGWHAVLTLFPISRSLLPLRSQTLKADWDRVASCASRNSMVFRTIPEQLGRPLRLTVQARPTPRKKKQLHSKASCSDSCIGITPSNSLIRKGSSELPTGCWWKLRSSLPSAKPSTSGSAIRAFEAQIVRR